jgi:hypothetical protein
MTAREARVTALTLTSTVVVLTAEGPRPPTEAKKAATLGRPVAKTIRKSLAPDSPVGGTWTAVHLEYPPAHLQEPFVVRTTINRKVVCFRTPAFNRFPA